jgi:hypothetical protein
VRFVCRFVDLQAITRPSVLVAVRTWAIWSQSRVILITLAVFSLVSGPDRATNCYLKLFPSGCRHPRSSYSRGKHYLKSWSVNHPDKLRSSALITAAVVPLVTPEFVDICSLTISNISHSFIVLYVLTMLYEFGNVTLYFKQNCSYTYSSPFRSHADALLDTDNQMA